MYTIVLTSVCGHSSVYDRVNVSVWTLWCIRSCQCGNTLPHIDSIVTLHFKRTGRGKKRRYVAERSKHRL